MCRGRAARHPTLTKPYRAVTSSSGDGHARPRGWARPRCRPMADADEGGCSMDIVKKLPPPRGVFGRRGFLTGVGATLVYSSARRPWRGRRSRAPAPRRRPVHARRRVRRSHADGVVLWTRLAPRSRSKATAGCRIAGRACSGASPATSRCGSIVDRGTVSARRLLGHAVHVEVQGLEAVPLVLVPVQGGQRVQHQSAARGPRRGAGRPRR